jgi:hypothetical protein
MDDAEHQRDFEHLRWEAFRAAHQEQQGPATNPVRELTRGLQQRFSEAIRNYLFVVMRTDLRSPDVVNAVTNQVIRVAAVPLIQQAPSELPTEAVLSSVAQRLAVIVEQRMTSAPIGDPTLSLAHLDWDTLRIPIREPDPQFTALVSPDEKRTDASEIEPATITYSSSHASVFPSPDEREAEDRLYFEALVNRFGASRAQQIFERYMRWAEDDTDSPHFPAGRGQVTLS